LQRAVAAAIGNGSGFKQGSDFAAWLSLIPKQESTGDRTILGKPRHTDKSSAGSHFYLRFSGISLRAFI
jgi:transposase